MQYTYIRTLAASVIFLAVSALKLLSPGFAQNLRLEIHDLINAQTDYKSAISALGESIAAPDGLLSVFQSTDDNKPASSALQTSSKYGLDRLNPRNWQLSAPWEAQENAAPPASAAPSAASAPEPEAAGEPEAAAETTPPPPPEPPDSEESAAPAFAETREPEEPVESAVVAAFLESQAPYSDYAVPANVSYEMPALPFSYQSPVPGLSGSGFGFRLHPLDGLVKFHYGTDIPANNGDDIYAFAGGTVRFVGEEESYGKYLIVDHGGGYATLYAHCSLIYVDMGQSISIGDKIALAGATGKVTGPHLHFELMSGQTYLNPEYYLYGL